MPHNSKELIMTNIMSIIISAEVPMHQPEDTECNKIF